MKGISRVLVYILLCVMLTLAVAVFVPRLFGLTPEAVMTSDLDIPKGSLTYISETGDTRFWTPLAGYALIFVSDTQGQIIAGAVFVVLVVLAILLSRRKVKKVKKAD